MREPLRDLIKRLRAEGAIIVPDPQPTPQERLESCIEHGWVLPEEDANG